MMKTITVIVALIVLGGLICVGLPNNNDEPKDLELESKVNTNIHDVEKLTTLKIEGVTELNMDGRQLREDDLKSIAENKHLKSLNLNGAYFRIEWLNHLKDQKTTLEHLNLSGTLVQDKHIPLIKEFINLKSLTLLNTSLTEKGLKKLALK